MGSAQNKCAKGAAAFPKSGNKKQEVATGSGQNKCAGGAAAFAESGITKQEVATGSAQSKCAEGAAAFAESGIKKQEVATGSAENKCAENAHVSGEEDGAWQKGCWDNGNESRSWGSASSWCVGADCGHGGGSSFELNRNRGRSRHGWCGSASISPENWLDWDEDDWGTRFQKSDMNWKKHCQESEDQCRGVRSLHTGPGDDWSHCRKQSTEDWRRKEGEKQKGRQRKPAELPPGDNRFALNKKDRENPRVYVCDNPNCRSVNMLKTNAQNFDGQYVNRLNVKGYSVEELKRKYLAGEVDCTWLCVKCQQLPGEEIRDTRQRLGIIDTKRVERTTRMISDGFSNFKRPKW